MSSAEQSIQKGFIGTIDDPDKERNYGLYFVAGNASPGWNYGVSGIVSGQNYGTGIYGSSLQDEGFNTGGRFAGLFHGDIKTTDAVYASAYNTLADSRLNKVLEYFLERGQIFEVFIHNMDLQSAERNEKLVAEKEQVAAQHKPFGVVAVAAGEKKSEAIIAATRHEKHDSLLTDEAAAQKIVGLLK